MSDIKINRKFCIFEVLDYKGGELIPELNISEKRLIDFLCEGPFGDIESSSISEISQQIKSKISDDTWKCIYAGGAETGEFCGEIYEIKNNRLKAINVLSFIKPLAAQIAKNNKAKP